MGDIKYAIEIFKQYGLLGLFLSVLILVIITMVKTGMFKKL